MITDANNILIVDDSPTQALYMKNLLERNGYRVSSVRNGREALASLREHRARIVVSDVMMPEMDGFELCREIKKDEDLKDISVILLSSLSNTKDILRGLESGADDFIIKSYGSQFILNCIEKELGGQPVIIEDIETEERASSDITDTPYENSGSLFQDQNDAAVPGIRGRAPIDMDIKYGGERFHFSVETMKVFDYFLTSLEIAVREHNELNRVLHELKLMNEQLETKVGQRTAALAQSEKELQERNTELEAAYEKLRDQSAQLIQTEKMSTVGTLVAGVAHELNNPMMGIINFVEYCLKYTTRDDKRYEILEKTAQAANRCMDIVKNLLSFSHVDSPGHGGYERKSCAMLLKNVLDLINYRIEKNNVALTVETRSDIPNVYIKSNSIQQVFLNLVTNALDALESVKERKLRIRLSVDGEYLRIAFSDNGDGIPPEKLSRIFDMFYTTKPVGKGTGLGLSICRNIIEEHGGDIYCESEVGIGTTFNVLLPIERNTD